MWEMVENYPMQTDLAGVTTSVWRLSIAHSVFVGVMRNSLFVPPTLWLEGTSFPVEALRLARHAADDLQRILCEPKVYAEAFSDEEKNIRFLEFLGFGNKQYVLDRVLFDRRI